MSLADVRMKPAAAALALFAALLTAGCSDAFDPFVESDEAFALYGFLDARRDTQYVRVQPIAERDTTGLVTARVTSTALATGETTAWQDSLIRLDDGTMGTVFFAPFRPQPGAAYRIITERLGEPGAVSTAEVTVPAEPSLHVADPNVVNGIVTQVLALDSAVRPVNVRVTYTVRPVGGQPRDFGFTYDARSATSGTAFEVFVSLLRDAGIIRTAFGIEPEDPPSVELLALRLAYDLVNERAGTTSGPGAVGAAASFAETWTLAQVAVDALGFIDAQGGERGRAQTDDA